MARTRAHLPVFIAAALSLTLPAVGFAAGPAPAKPAVKAAPKPAAKTAAKPKPKKKVSKKRGETKTNDDEEEETTWAIGLTGGANLANVGGDPLLANDSIETNMNVGFSAGLVALYNLASFADVEFGLGYSTKGYSSEAESDIPEKKQTATVDTTLSYIEIPIGIRLNYPAGSIRPYLGLGIYAGFLVGSEQSQTLETDYKEGVGACPTANDPDRQSQTCSSTGTVEVDGANTFDFGFKVQGGAEFDVTDAMSVYVGAGYSRSFTDPVNETKDGGGIASIANATPAMTDMAAPSATTDTAPTTQEKLEDASQAHSVIQIVGGIMYAF